ncbi:MAG: LpqB family beta-propeller domain-containing protein [Actinomycetes bacterium]
MRAEPRRARALPVVLLLGVALALTSACATIPASGPVQQGRDLVQGPREQDAKIVGQPPADGATPEAIVSGFLQSGADFRRDHSFAREYLTAAARSSWDPATSTTIYDKSDVSFDPQADGSILMTATEVARIAADGQYKRLPPKTLVKRNFPLTRVRGQWRIKDVEDGLLLSTTDLVVSYRHFNLYFLTPKTTTVVPDPVLLPATLPGLATKLVTRLLQGPTGALQGAVETAFPQGTKLEVASVPVRSGVATVDLNAAALQGDADARNRMSAQIVYTLRQLPDIRRIHIRAAGDELVTSGIVRDQPVTTSWAVYDPDILGASASLYAVRDDRVGQLVSNGFAVAPGPAGVARSGFRQPAVSLDASRVAVTNATRNALFVGRFSQAGPLEQVRLPGPVPDLSPASWDRNSDLWFVDRAGGRLMMYSRETQTVSVVRVPRLAGGVLSGVRVAREGTRVALVAGRGAGSRLYLGAVVRTTSGAVREIGAVREVLPDLRGIVDLSWVDADTLVVVGARGDQLASPLLTSTDGLEVNADVTPLKGLVAIAAAPAGSKKPLVAATDTGQLQEWDPSLGWQPLGAGRDPAYPG